MSEPTHDPTREPTHGPTHGQQGHQHGHPHGHGGIDPTDVRFTEDFWDERYSSAPTIWSGNPNGQLIAQVADLPPGSALDAGCGEGADALWLARQGWRVLATDWSGVAVRRAAEHVAHDPAGRLIDFQQHDLTTWDPGEATFDLVSSQFLHLPPADRDATFTRLAGSVRPGGTLLIVGHHPLDLQTSMPRPNVPDLFWTGDQIDALLEPGGWTVITNEAIGRSVADPDGVMITIYDAVYRAVRNPAVRNPAVRNPAVRKPAVE